MSNHTLPDQVYQLLTPQGQLVGSAPDLADEQFLALYRWMVLSRQFSDRMVALQRQGRTGTFAALNGQEAAAALALPLQPDDWLAGSYRDIPAYLCKGVPLLALMETYQGRVGAHYPKETHVLPFQIILGTQMLHAVGIAMGIQYDGKPQVAVGICGDGATSEGDFNEALNFAGVFRAPVVLVVQDNQWAISTQRGHQTAAARIAHRGVGFGVPAYLVDGNDALALYQVMSECVARARAGDGPSLIETITYRLGAHSTADDPTKYRTTDELSEWQARDPLLRYRRFLMDRSLLSPNDDELLHEEVDAEIQAAVEELEALPPQDPTVLFDYVYAEPTPQLREQRAALFPG
ncbi:MAG: pyruvate dehydrogenase (acetyl-transferring) E1 component subunit alpha [Caldilineaceae bacterium]